MAIKKPSGTPVKITDEMVAVYATLMEIVDVGDEDFWEEDGGRRREYLDLNGELHRQLKLDLSEYPPTMLGAEHPKIRPLHVAYEAAVKGAD